MEEAFNRTFNLVTKSSTAGGIYVEVTFRTFAFDIAWLYYEAERSGWDQTQLEDQIRGVINYFATSEYPGERELGLRNLYQIYTTLYPSFDVDDPAQRFGFETFRNNYLTRVLNRIYQGDILRDYYSDKWGYAKYDRLDFSIYMENRGVEPLPIADIGARTFLVDEGGVRHAPRGLFGPYPHKFDRPRGEVLEHADRYRVFFVNRTLEGDPIVTTETRLVKLVIYGLGGVPRREFKWNLPFHYPTIPRRLRERF